MRTGVGGGEGGGSETWELIGLKLILMFTAVFVEQLLAHISIDQRKSTHNSAHRNAQNYEQHHK